MPAPLPSSFPLSYKDPLYGQLARATEAKLGLPSGILDAIRTRGERSNADQISSARARGPYQFIPATRRGFIKVYGIDPWSDPEAQTEAAGLHLRDDYKRTGSWDESIARYFGGQRPKASAYAYQSRVGDFDREGMDMPNPYYGIPQGFMPPGSVGGYMPVPDAEAVPYADRLAPEAPREAAPVMPDAGPSVSVPAAAPVTAHKRGGILGALASIFTPDPNTIWGQALTGEGGLFNARANLDAYRQQKAKDSIDMAMAGAKLKNLLTKGEYQIAGNNLVHFAPDGSAEIIAPPQTPGEKERLIDAWRSEQDPGVKSLIERLILGGNDSDVIREKGVAAQGVARTRAAAAAANRTTKQPNPPTGFRLDP